MSDVNPRSANEVFATQLQDDEIQPVYKEIEQHAIDFAVKADILGQAKTGTTEDIKRLYLPFLASGELDVQVSFREANTDSGKSFHLRSYEAA